MCETLSILEALAETKPEAPAEYYIPEDDCTTGLCESEGLFVPHVIDNIDLDKEFIGSEIDTELRLSLANIDDLPLSDELFPPILDVAPITLEGLLDCFARKYPNRAQLLAVLVEKNGYSIEWIEDYAEEKQALEYERDHMPHIFTIGPRYSPEQRTRLDEISRRLIEIRHWRITDKKIILMPQIDKNIDTFNLLGIQNDSLIKHLLTNEEGADWLNAVMGDWMVRNGIPGASSDEEFTDNYTSRVVWGSLSVVLGAVEVVGGVLLVPTGAVSYGVGTVAGVAMTVAGFEAFTQGLDMLRTPEESFYSTGWLGDSVKAMSTHFGYIPDDNYASFDKYWGFAMLGLSLGGAGVITTLPKAARVSLGVSRSTFSTTISNRTLTQARMALTGIKDAMFGKFKISFVTLPSARTVFNVAGVGRFVAPVWESLPRLRLRFIADEFAEVQERARKLAHGEAGLVSIRGGVNTQIDATRLVEEAAAAMGVSSKRLWREYISSVELGPIGSRSSFNGRLIIKIRQDIGAPLNGIGEYNEFRALTEAMHEIYHALRYRQHIKTGGDPRQYWHEQSSSKYWQEEALVESSAQKYMRMIAEPRVQQMHRYGNLEKARELKQMLEDAIKESGEYIAYAKRQSGQ